MTPACTLTIALAPSRQAELTGEQATGLSCINCGIGPDPDAGLLPAGVLMPPAFGSGIN